MIVTVSQPRSHTHTHTTLVSSNTVMVTRDSQVNTRIQVKQSGSQISLSQNALSTQSPQEASPQINIRGQLDSDQSMRALQALGMAVHQNRVIIL